MHRDDADPCRNERLRRREVVQLVCHARLEVRLGAEPFEDRAEASRGSLAPRHDQRLAVEVSHADRVAACERVSLRHHHPELVEEQRATLEVRCVGYGDSRHVVHHREVGLAGSDALGGLPGLELEHLDDGVGMRAAEIANRGWNERRQRAGERREANAAHALMDVGQRRPGGAHRGQNAFHVRAHELAGVGGAQGSLRAVDQRHAKLPLERRELLRHRRLRIAEHARRSRDRSEVHNEREGAKALGIAEGHEAMLLTVEAIEVALIRGCTEDPGHDHSTNTHTGAGPGYAVSAGDGERIWIVGDTMTLKATAGSPAAT